MHNFGLYLARTLSPWYYTRTGSVTVIKENISQLAALPVIKETYLPELLASILSSHSLQDLWSTRVLVNELCNIVDLVVNNNP